MSIRSIVYEVKNIWKRIQNKRFTPSEKIKFIFIVGIVCFVSYQYLSKETSYEDTSFGYKEYKEKEYEEKGYKAKEYEAKGYKAKEYEAKGYTPTLQQYPVVYVLDGDTYIVQIHGKKEKVRVLGIDTPEKSGGFRPAGCFGDEASLYAKHQLKNKKVSLIHPKGYSNTDKYGRLLRYVLVNGKDFGAHLISEGYAFSYKKFYHPRQQYYNMLEKNAQKQQKGMWSPINCQYLDGKRKERR